MAVTKLIQQNENKIIDASEVRDVVFPFFKVSEQSKKLKLEKFLGTGFLIGDKGFVMTATHVITQND